MYDADWGVEIPPQLRASAFEVDLSRTGRRVYCDLDADRRAIIQVVYCLGPVRSHTRHGAIQVQYKPILTDRMLVPAFFTASFSIPRTACSALLGHNQSAVPQTYACDE